jgi:F-box protein 11
MSYVHSDDVDERLTELRERLSKETHIQTGEPFEIFQDRNAILWGQNWKERIDESIDEVTFLIPIITPSFFNSPSCREELERFLGREQELDRDDLVLPIYYVDTPLINEDAQRARDPLAQVIASRQYADWRELRHEPFTSPQVGKTLARLSTQIREALERTRLPQEPNTQEAKPDAASKSQKKTADARQEHTETLSVGRDFTNQPTIKREPPTHVVDPLHRGDYATITEAVKNASPGDRILVRPGLYQEGIYMDKPLEIIGEGDLDEIVVQARDLNTLLFSTTMGRVTNLTLRQAGPDIRCVRIWQGRLELEGCNISSQGATCVDIRDGADPRLRRNRIHGSNQDGVIVENSGRGTLEDNDIYGHGWSGVMIRKEGDPTLRHNHIHENKADGIDIRASGRGTVEDNEISSNGERGIEITGSSHPTLARNRIHDNQEHGVKVSHDGRGILEDNAIYSNWVCGVSISRGARPTLRGNRIKSNGDEAVWVHDDGGGTVEDNDLRDNRQGAWDVDEDSAANLIRAGNQE